MSWNIRHIPGTSISRLAAVSPVLLFLGWSAIRTARPAVALDRSPAVQSAATAAVPVIVELFTSEGCSSCPPADALLAYLEAQQPVPKTQIIALEEHVDYWNSDGWMDPFSNREWTLRQQDYAGTLKNRNPYTPQMIVDGRTEFVGGNDRAAVQAIEKAAAQPKAHVTLSVAPSAKPGVEQATVSVDQLTATNHSDKPEVWLAVTESGLHSAVSAGENAGSELHHASVVRAFHKVTTINLNKETSFAGTTPVHLDSSWKLQNVTIVVFVQEQKSRQILGAATTRIEP
jgi:hypothetical protein